MMKKNFSLLPYLLLVILSFIWGSSFILIKRGLNVYDAGEVGALRIVAASIFLFPIALKGFKKVQSKEWKFLLAVGFFGSLIPSFLFAIAQTQIPSSVAGILNALTPMFTMIIGFLLFGQKFNSKTIIGLVIGLFGTIILVMAGSTINWKNINFYSLFVVLATVFYGANLNLIKYKLPDINARLITSVSLVLVGPIALIYLFAFTDFVHKTVYVPNAFFSLSAVVLLGFLGTAIALIIFNQLVKITTPIFTSSVTYLIPIIAVFWGLWDREMLYLSHFIGMGVIILGVYLINKKRK